MIDSFTWRISLRTDKSFRRGHPLTAHDVYDAYSGYYEFLDQNSFVGPTTIEIDVLDDYTFDITTNRDTTYKQLLKHMSEVFIIKEFDQGGENASKYLGTGNYLIAIDGIQLTFELRADVNNQMALPQVIEVTNNTHSLRDIKPDLLIVSYTYQQEEILKLANEQSIDFMFYPFDEYTLLRDTPNELDERRKFIDDNFILKKEIGVQNNFVGSLTVDENVFVTSSAATNLYGLPITDEAIPSDSIPFNMNRHSIKKLQEKIDKDARRHKQNKNTYKEADIDIVELGQMIHVRDDHEVTEYANNILKLMKKKPKCNKPPRCKGGPRSKCPKLHKTDSLTAKCPKN